VSNRSARPKHVNRTWSTLICWGEIKRANAPEVWAPAVISQPLVPPYRVSYQFFFHLILNISTQPFDRKSSSIHLSISNSNSCVLSMVYATLHNTSSFSTYNNTWQLKFCRYSVFIYNTIVAVKVKFSSWQELLKTNCHHAAVDTRLWLSW